MKRWKTWAVAVLLASSGASAQVSGGHQSSPCPAAPAELPAALSGWSSPNLLVAARNRTGLSAAVLEPGKSAQVTLAPTPQVHYPLRPEKPGGSVSYGGLLTFAVPKRGTYHVALGAGAWIDVVRHGKAAVSIAHGPGPACTGLRKMVDFTLEPGRYTLQIGANGTPSIEVMLVRQP